MPASNTNSASEEECDLRQCAEWLNRCRTIPDDHPTLMPDGCGLQLVQTLMDGVKLCNLLNTLTNGEVDPRKMRDFSPQTQQSPFLCFKNIRLFVKLCEEEFGIDKSYLIEPGDLYHAKNFGKVIELLSRLSRCPRAQLSGIPEDMQATAESNYADMEEETNEMVYDTIVHGGKGSTTQTEDEPTSPRSFCIKEIVSTEKNYVDVLKMLIEKYKWPLSKCLSSQELEEIFKYIEELHCIHRELLSNLSLAVSTTLAVLTLGEVFIKIRDRLLIYGGYCGHVQKAQTLVLEITKNDVEKRTKIQECQAQSENYSKFHLTELLTVPMQRVLKYHLLLEQLCRLTDDDHPEKPELVTALDGMRELAQTINEVKRDLDTISAIDQIQASLLEITLPPDKKLSSYGRRHIDGELRVLNHLDSKSKIRYVFLFDKILLLCKSKGDNYTFMAAYHIVNGSPQPLGLPSKKGGKFPYEFTIPLAGERDEDVQLTFFAKSEEFRNAWIKATETALSNQFPPGAKDNGYQFEMATFKQTTYCCVCKKLLQGVFYQGYQCRETGLAAHKACLVNVPTLLLPHTSMLVTNGGTAYHRGSHIPGVFRPSIASMSIPSQQSSALSSANHHHLSQQQQHRVSRNTSSVSTDSANSSSLHLRTSSNSFEAIGDVFAARATVITAVAAYSGEPPPPLSPPGAFGDPSKRLKPLSFNTGDRITLTQPFDGSRWLHGRLNDQEGWFPASHVEIPMKSDSLSNLTTPSLGTLTSLSSSSTRTELPPIPPDGDGGAGVTRSSSLRTYTTPNSNGGVKTTGRHYSCAAAPLLSPPTNQSFSSMSWYFGEMDRAEATQLLTGCENGTFLVRISKNVSRMGEYSLSVVYHHPRHIRIQRSSDSCFYLCSPQRFKSLEALVDFYCRVSLNECFDEVQTCLRFPYQRCPEDSVLFYARAQHDFEGDANPRMLPLTRGDLVHVISTRAKEQGWWKGWLNGRIGFFPLSFVTRQP
ncbi:guanine nucleotide exchange factor VAV2 [Echinococcus multilocularis]|uniref:Guanine nucleotide exchange factor VAV2 n=1 Tax=Echinococcus multilocularis TaxID=6211 RepID=A0A087W2B6_ECHMU|nr:guanine nucleotide exchange factor VAV2 [Echinococcus multilocularis]